MAECMNEWIIEALVNYLLFADDIGHLAKSQSELQDITTKIDETSRKFGA